jgi:hypothetical protein
MNELTDTTQTAYGCVVTKALRELQASFDTTQLLDAVTHLDSLRAVVTDTAGLRANLLRLHAMANTVINGGPLTAIGDEETITELTADVQAQLEELQATLFTVFTAVAPLEALTVSESPFDVR